MSERERWVVYPLLFLALGAALRDKLVDRTTTKSIICQELIVVDEQPLGRDPVLLARIGRGERAAGGGSSSGQFVLNGQMEVVDRDPTVHDVPAAVTVGCAPPTPTAGPRGFILVDGQIAVDGAINAKQYAYQGVPLVPALQAVLPGVSWHDLLRAMQQAAQQHAKDKPPQDAPPSNKPAEQTRPATDRANGEDGPPPPAAPLADPGENR